MELRRSPGCSGSFVALPHDLHFIWCGQYGFFDFKGTGTPVRNGITEKEAGSLLVRLIQNEKVICFEISEVNLLLIKKIWWLKIHLKFFSGWWVSSPINSLQNNETQWVCGLKELKRIVSAFAGTVQDLEQEDKIILQETKKNLKVTTLWFSYSKNKAVNHLKKQQTRSVHTSKRTPLCGFIQCCEGFLNLLVADSCWSDFLMLWMQNMHCFLIEKLSDSPVKPRFLMVEVFISQYQ